MDKNPYPISLKIKSLVASVAFNSGVLNKLKLYKLKGKSFVLMYHRIISSAEMPEYPVQPGMYVFKDIFQQHIEYLSKNFNILPFEYLIENVSDGKDVTGCCSITFDDGWRDNFDNAFPILNSFNVPATIYLTTGYIGTNNWFWPEELSCYLDLLKKREDPSLIKKTPEEIRKFVNLDKDKKDTISTAIESVKLMTNEKRTDILSCLEKLLGRVKKKRVLMDWSEVMKMQESGIISFGAHTVSHKILDQLSTQDATIEIAESLKSIEEHLGHRVGTFAYPNGNYNEDLQKILKGLGVKGAVTTKKGYFHKTTSKFAIPRIGIHNDISRTTPLFLSRILINSF